MTTIESNKEKYEKLYSQLQNFPIMDVWATIKDAHHYGHISEEEYRHEMFLWSDISNAKDKLEKYLRRSLGINIIEERLQEESSLEYRIAMYPFTSTGPTVRDLVEEYFPMFDLKKDCGNNGEDMLEKLKLVVKYHSGEKDVYECNIKHE